MFLLNLQFLVIYVLINIIIIIIIITTNPETDSKCRPCQQFDETIDHIISACSILAKEQ